MLLLIEAMQLFFEIGEMWSWVRARKRSQMLTKS